MRHGRLEPLSRTIRPAIGNATPMPASGLRQPAQRYEQASALGLACWPGGLEAIVAAMQTQAIEKSAPVEVADALTLRAAAARLREAGIEEPEREARLLLAHALGIAAEELIARGPTPPASFAALVERRAAREPLALIVGRREFWSLSFAVSPATLIPRPESETLIEAGLSAFPDRQRVRRILDLGTGTGCLLLALLSEFRAAFGVGTDRVAAATALAAGNAERLGLADRASFLAGDWAAPLGARFDLVVANPPYVEQAAIGTLMPEVARFEPESALDGGADGLDCYRQILPDLPRLLAPAGVAILEVGAGAAAAVLSLARRAGLDAREFRADVGGIPRALSLAASATKKPFGIGRWAG